MISAAYRQRAARSEKQDHKSAVKRKETPIADISVKDAAVTVLTRRKKTSNTLKPCRCLTKQEASSQNEKQI